MGFEGGVVLRVVFREIGRSFAPAGRPDRWPRRMFPLIQPAAFQIGHRGVPQHENVGDLLVADLAADAAVGRIVLGHVGQSLGGLAS